MRLHLRGASSNKNMGPSNLKTKIFLDSGDPSETREIIKLLGFLDGQTTNPTLIAKNPEAKKRLEKGEKFTKEEILSFYKSVVKEISNLIKDGSVSVEVYADKSTSSKQMFAQGKEMFAWIPNAHIKYPTSIEGLKAAEQSAREGMRVNMTLCFNQEQAAAVYAATLGAKKAQVFVSPFVGRLDDRGENGMDLIKNIIAMYKKGDGHLEVLAASVRNMDHLLYSLKLGCDIITAPFKILKEWGEKGMFIPSRDFNYQTSLKEIPYKQINLNRSWQKYTIADELTDKGMEKFSDDWNSLVL